MYQSEVKEKVVQWLKDNNLLKETKEKEPKPTTARVGATPRASAMPPLLTVPHVSALVTSDVDTKEPWAPDTKLIIPIEQSQVLIYEFAAIVGAQVFLNIAQLPYTVEERPNAANISPNGKLPVLRCGTYMVSELEGIVQLAQTKGVSLSDHLNANQKSDLCAYKSLVYNILGNALLHFTWVDSYVYNNLTRFRAGSPYNFPLCYVVPWSTRRRVVTQLDIINWGERKADQVYYEVENCLLALNEQLGENEYFFGESPTEFDALVFGYLFAIVSTPLPKNQLGNFVKQKPNLLNFCEKMEKKYFCQNH